MDDDFKDFVYFPIVSLFGLIVFFDSCKNDEDPAPVITAVEPDHGAVGESVTISGDHFTSDAIVSFNGTPATISGSSTTQLVVVVPANATSGSISVKAHNQTTEGPVFTVEIPPSVTSITPQSGKAGDQVTINGANFSATTTVNVVKFNGTSAVVNSATTTQLVVVVPSGVTTGNISVSVNGRETSGPLFTVIPPPTITTISPTSAVPGATVTITRKYFSIR